MEHKRREKIQNIDPRFLNWMKVRLTSNNYMEALDSIWDKVSIASDEEIYTHQSDCTACRKEGRCWRDAADSNTKVNECRYGMERYWEYRIQTTLPQQEIQMPPRTIEMLQVLRDNAFSLYEKMEKWVLGEGDAFKDELHVKYHLEKFADLLRKKPEKWTDLQKTIFEYKRNLILKRRKEHREMLIDHISEVFLAGTRDKNGNIDYYRFIDRRNQVSQLAQEMMERWRGLEGSAVWQILLQLRGVRITKTPPSRHDDSADGSWHSVNDWFDHFEDDEKRDALCAYISALLEELYITVLGWDGVSALPPRIFDAPGEVDGFGVACVAPFTRMLADEEIIDPVAKDAEDISIYREFKWVTQLIQAGILYVDVSSNKRMLYKLKVMPLHLRAKIADGSWNQCTYDDIPHRLLQVLLAQSWDRRVSDITVAEDLVPLLERLHAIRKQMRDQCDCAKDELEKLNKEWNKPLSKIHRLTENIHIWESRIKLLSSNIKVLEDTIIRYCEDMMRSGDIGQGQRANALMLRLWKVQIIADAAPLLFWQGKLKELAYRVRKEGTIAWKDYTYFSIKAKENFYDLTLLEPMLPEDAMLSAAGNYLDVLLYPLNHAAITSDTSPGYFIDCIVPCEKAIRTLENMYGSTAVEKFDQMVATARGRIGDAVSSAELFEEKQRSQWAANCIRQSAPEIWVPTAIPVDLNNKYFLGDLDSVAIKLYGDATEVEARLMAHLIRGQRVVLSLPQLCDCKLLRDLALIPDFQWILRSGRICVSAYGTHYHLLEYCASQMGTTFAWSSLPQVFHDPAYRHQAADYFRGKIALQDVSGEIREELMIFKAAIIALDENIPYESRAACYQRPSTTNVTYESEMAAAYHHLETRKWEDCGSLIRVHNRVERALEVLFALPQEGYFRSHYRQVLDMVCNDDMLNTELSRLEKSAAKKLAAHIRHAREERLTQQVIEQLYFICDDTYLRSIASRFTKYMSMPYTAQQQELIRPELNQDVYRDQIRFIDKARGYSWSEVRELLMRLDHLLQIGSSLDLIVCNMEDPMVGFGVTAAKGKERLAINRALLKTSSGASVEIELTSAGVCHVETIGR